MDWLTASRSLVEIISSCPFRKQNVFKLRLHKYIAEIHPDVLIDNYLEANSDIEDQIAFYSSTLLALDLSNRLEVFQRCLKDLSPLFPTEISEIEQFIEKEQVGQQEVSSYFQERQERIDKLNRYLKRIDGAIYNRRYSLALGLANRCLREYYSHFLKHTAKYDLKYSTSMNQMAMYVYRYITKYFKANNIPYSATRLLFITITTNALFLAMSSNTYVDRAVAMYARDNVNSIVRFLLRYS